MSADNYLYVRKLPNGKWTVTMEFMSNDGLVPLSAIVQMYDTWIEAYKAAQKWEQEEPYGCEYGIHSDPAE